MSYNEYVKAISDLLSDDPGRVCAGNKALFDAAVEGEDRKKNPLLALADADQG